MFDLSSIYNSLEFWSVNHTWMYENFELNVFKNTKFLEEIPSNWSSNLFTYLYLSNFIVSEVKSLKQYPALILFTYILKEGLSVFSLCFFNIFSKIIFNIWYIIRSGGSNVSFHVGADILNL